MCLLSSIFWIAKSKVRLPSRLHGTRRPGPKASLSRTLVGVVGLFEPHTPIA